MTSFSYLKTHHTWEDFLGMLLGALIVASPWLAGQMSSPIVVLNAALVGTIVFALALLSLVDVRLWEEGVEMACGAWLLVSPYILSYSQTGQLQNWHALLGAAVVVLAMYELWQDWQRPNNRTADNDT